MRDKNATKSNLPYYIQITRKTILYLEYESKHKVVTFTNYSVHIKGILTV